MKKTLDNFFGKMALRKKLTITIAVVFFLVLSFFTLLVLFLADTLLLNHERNNVQRTLASVVSYVEKDKNDEELSAESLAQYLYGSDSLPDSIENGALSEADILEGKVSISHKLYVNQEIFLYNPSGALVFTTTNDTKNPPGITTTDNLATVSYKEGKGYILTEPIYASDGTTVIGYAQIFHDLEFYYNLKHKMIFFLLLLELGIIVLVILATLIVMTSVLRPMKELHETMETIANSPNELELRSKVRTRDEIGDLAANFNHMMDKIEENNQMQMRFLSDVSHELRTPIAVIKGHMDLLQRWGKNDPEILDESLEAAGHEANRMTIMINDMLDSIRVKGSFDMHKNDTSDLNSSLKTVVGNFQILHEDYRFTFDNSESSSRLAQIYSQHFEQALTILMDNAVKYSPVNKEIWVTIKDVGDEMLVQVQDKGDGISSEDINHIFERFYRTDKARNRTSTQAGVGIGLSILHQIVEAYHCRIEVSSELGVGTRFDFYIPFADSKKSGK